jgi:hypothetical protein
MSARATETCAEVSKLDEASLSQMQVRLERWGVLLDTLEAETLAGRKNLSGRDGESIADLRANYRTTCQRFFELKAHGHSRWEEFAANLQVAWSDFEGAVAEYENRV